MTKRRVGSRVRGVVSGMILTLSAHLAAAEWKPAPAPLLSRWAKDVSPENVHGEYPRPQLRRERWESLNGLWDYAITKRSAARPDSFEGRILVPFAVESALSGVGRTVGVDSWLWYRRTFEIPDLAESERWWLHFGAVDWEAEVWLNGQRLGLHRGGYDAFSFELTPALRGEGAQELVVRVWDPTDGGHGARGKQLTKPHGIWYTSVTGIWQSVWLEPVPQVSIESLKITPNLDRGSVRVESRLRGDASDLRLRAVASANAAVVGEASGKTADTLELELKDVRAWSPESPFLYDLRIEVLDAGGRQLDAVDSYFGLRKISVAKDANDVPRLLLNNRVVFQYGPLDQGWWPDGLYTAPTDAALLYDLEMTKKLGFNMVRKHVKVEPARWYYHCDRIGLLVWQDMPNGDRNVAWPRHGTEGKRTPESTEQFELELERLIDGRYNSPSIVIWVPFNEAWGQYDTDRIARWTQAHDPTRLVNAASGGNDFATGDIYDLHEYPGPAAPPALRERVAVLGEYGGLGLPTKGHLWQDKENWGYRTYSDRASLNKAYLDLLEQLQPLIESRLAAAIYTQTTDVESEINGWMTYDREVVKFDVTRVAEAHRKLYTLRAAAGGVDRHALHTLAYWRFEDTAAGELVPHDREKRDGFAAVDVSGHRNHLFAYAAANAPRGSGDCPAAIVPQTRAPNRGVLDDRVAPPEGIGTRDLYSDPGRAHCRMTLNTFQLSEWTIELSFNLDALGRQHALLGKDGKPTESPHAPLQLGVDPKGHVVVTALDAGGLARTARSSEPITPGRWYHVAARCDGKSLALFVHRGSDPGYREEARVACSGGLLNSDGTWTLGRGFFDGKLAHDARTLIDEVRVSVVALEPTEFLFTAR